MRNQDQRQRGASDGKARVQAQVLLRDIANGALIVDSAGVVVAINGATERLLGYPDGELAGKPISLAIAWPSGTSFADYISAVPKVPRNRHPADPIHVSVICKNGLRLDLLATLTPTTMQHPLHFLITLHPSPATAPQHAIEQFADAGARLLALHSQDIVFRRRTLPTPAYTYVVQGQRIWDTSGPEISRESAVVV